MAQQQQESTHKFKSGLNEYLSRIERVYNPTVVQSKNEFVKQLEDLSFEYSLAVKTVILPEGVTLSDPRLTTTRTISGKTYMLQPGEKFIQPNVCYIGDIDEMLVPPAAGPYLRTETRYQILGEEQIPCSIQLALDSKTMSLYQPSSYDHPNGKEERVIF